MPTQHIVLVGLMASGKTTIGRRIADQLRVPLVDNDDVLRHHTDQTAADIARGEGVERLHHLELAVLRLTLSRPDFSVITAAASVADRPSESDRLLRRHWVVALWAPPDVLAARARSSADGRRPDPDPDVSLETTLACQYERRFPVYAQIASHVIDVVDHPPDLAATAVLDRYVAHTTRGASHRFPYSEPSQD